MKLFTSLRPMGRVAMPVAALAALAALLVPQAATRSAAHPSVRAAAQATTFVCPKYSRCNDSSWGG